MILEESLNVIESANNIDDMLIYLQNIIDSYGFSALSFIDYGCPESRDLIYFSTTDSTWVRTYKDNNFLNMDPVARAARRTNAMFRWSSLASPLVLRKKGPKPVNVLHAARDFGYIDGLTLPFHYNDSLGRRRSHVCSLFWKNTFEAFRHLFLNHRLELQIILLHWAQKVVDLNGIATKTPSPPLNLDNDTISLTGREKDVLCWAARGKTAQETAMILNISYDTVDTHMRHAVEKLNASTKTHAAVKAIYLGLIDI